MTPISRKMVALLAALLALIIPFAGCGEDTKADEPPKINYGVDVCSRCGMIISEERYASGIVDEDGDALIFDDAGEMIFMLQEEGVNDRRVWVHDAESLEWIDGTEAYYVVSMDVVTPMGTGVTAFAEESDAEAFAAENQGTVMTWDEMLSDWEWQRMHE